MFSISNNGIVRVTRGDTFSLSVDINVGTQLQPILYNLKKGDVVYFGLMEPNKPFECAVLKKAYSQKDQQKDNSSILMNFSHDDTAYLVPGNYYYMIKLVRSANDESCFVDTIVDKTKFILLD